MIQRLILVCVVLFHHSPGSDAGNIYDGLHMLSARPDNAEQTEMLRDYLFEAMVEVLNDVGYKITFLVSSEDVDQVKSYIENQLDIPIAELLADVGKTVYAEKQRLQKQRSEAVKHHRKVFNISDFNSFTDMIDQLDVFAADCPRGLACATDVLGESFQERELKYLLITADISDEDRPAVWMDSLIHSNEWITGTTLMNIIDNMIRTYGSDDTVTRLLDTYNWYFLPVVNPDGYDYTWIEERLWRKSRSENDDPNCPGTDLNRNFDYKWLTAGASNETCASNFGGSAAASEPETQAIQDFAQGLSSNLVAWLTLHAPDNQWLHPYGTADEDDEETCDVSPDADDQSQAAAAAATAAGDSFNTTWASGAACEVRYTISGGSMDYVYAEVGVKYAYQIQLRTGDGDVIVPPDQIPPAFRETWNGVVAMMEEIEDIEGTRDDSLVY